MSVKDLTREYNLARKNFSFPTVPVDECAITAITDMYPEIMRLPRAKQIKRIAEEVSLIHFSGRT